MFLVLFCGFVWLNMAFEKKKLTFEIFRSMLLWDLKWLYNDVGKKQNEVGLFFVADLILFFSFLILHEMEQMK